jgi:hypothetical protein
MKALLQPSLAVLALALCAGCAHNASGPGAALNQPAAALSACAVALQARADAAVEVPFELINGRIYLHAQVNGQGPYKFAIDTGASDLARSDARLTAALSLDVTGHTETSDGVSTATVNTVHFDSLTLGGQTRENFDVITRDYGSNMPEAARFDGIIARDFFNDGLLVIDFPAQRLYFTRTSGLSADQAGALSYERAFRVPVTIGELATTGNLDTGASVTLVLPRTVYDQVADGPLEPAGQGRLTNGTIETYRGTLPGPVRFGDASFSNVEVRVSERYPEVLIGGGLLRDFVVAMDQRSQTAAVCSPQG